ncbi:heptosyltransferase [Thermodesulfomicrobium sp. WS]|uniref:glycosyltransferase family 9 protein n=1 Tax=Thermodesulfomicrobium sp. WS TaxID=3004129 RepID=UPI002491DA7D|nr:glycosyltransferase family 9 protein [Thermodesulfomicrobium sp. WS]BDV01048.1 heptosyltransferase [Thermodesulfomicrobium sp. WS]
MHAVMIRLSALGDVTLTTGVLHFWHQTRGMTFTVVTRDALTPLFAGHPAVRDVIAVTEAHRSAHGWLRCARALARRFAGSPLIDLHGTLRTRLLQMLWHGPVHRYPKFTLTRRLFRATHHPGMGARLLAASVPQRYALALEPQAPTRTSLAPRLFPSPEELAWARALLEGLGLCRPLALHPYATHPAKTPKPAWWRILLRTLQEAGVPCLVIGHSSTPLIAHSPVDRTSRDSLRQTMALLSLCQGLVTGDSGPMHLAWGVDTPVFALFGPTTAHWGFAPAGARHHILTAPCPKAPCSLHGQTPCPGGATCLDRLDPQATAASILHWRARVAA